MEMILIILWELKPVDCVRSFLHRNCPQGRTFRGIKFLPTFLPEEPRATWGPEFFHPPQKCYVWGETTITFVLGHTYEKSLLWQISEGLSRAIDSLKWVYMGYILYMDTSCMSGKHLISIGDVFKIEYRSIFLYLHCILLMFAFSLCLSKFHFFFVH